MTEQPKVGMIRANSGYCSPGYDVPTLKVIEQSSVAIINTARGIFENTDGTITNYKNGMISHAQTLISMMQQIDNDIYVNMEHVCLITTDCDNVLQVFLAAGRALRLKVAAEYREQVIISGDQYKIKIIL